MRSENPKKSVLVLPPLPKVKSKSPAAARTSAGEQSSNPAKTRTDILRTLRRIEDRKDTEIFIDFSSISDRKLKAPNRQPFADVILPAKHPSNPFRQCHLANLETPPKDVSASRYLTGKD
jgi:hypothetical protein